MRKCDYPSGRRVVSFRYFRLSNVAGVAHCAHRTTSPRWSFHPRFPFSSSGSPVDPRMRASNDGLFSFLSSHSCLSRESPDCPSLRASSDHRFIVGALRARRIVRWLPSFLLRARVPRAGGRASRPIHFFVRVLRPETIPRISPLSSGPLRCQL